MEKHIYTAPISIHLASRNKFGPKATLPNNRDRDATGHHSELSRTFFTSIVFYPYCPSLAGERLPLVMRVHISYALDRLLVDSQHSFPTWSGKGQWKSLDAFEETRGHLLRDCPTDLRESVVPSAPFLYKLPLAGGREKGTVYYIEKCSFKKYCPKYKSLANGTVCITKNKSDMERADLPACRWYTVNQGR